MAKLPQWSWENCDLPSPAFPSSLAPSRTPSPVRPPGVVCRQDTSGLACTSKEGPCLSICCLCVSCIGCIIRAAESKSHPSSPRHRRVSRSCTFPSCPSKERRGRCCLLPWGKAYIRNPNPCPTFWGCKSELPGFSGKVGFSFFGNSQQLVVADVACLGTPTPFANRESQKALKGV